MPVSKQPTPPAPNGERRPTLAELVAIRRQQPPPPAVTGRASLADRFLVPPFSVLDARQGYWQKRKREWLALGIRSEIGRGENALGLSEEARQGDLNHYRDENKAAPGGGALPLVKGKDGYRSRGAHPIPGGGTGKNSAYMFKTEAGYKSLKEQQQAQGKRFAKAYNIGMQGCKENDWSVEDDQGSGTSIFDPVLCEIAYRWFCPTGGRVLDPFAGGSVRGIVAAMLGRSYRGVELRPEQKDANDEQADHICPDAQHESRLSWVVGNALDTVNLLCPPRGPTEDTMYDLVFSCPPYFDLERYSDDPRDLSTMDYPAFLFSYRDIIKQCVYLLKEDRFACFVVGDVRNRENGVYRGFVNHTIDAFGDAGLELYNEAILLTSVGSLPIRVGKQFTASRKLGKTHQNVLVFVKGDPARAAAACGEVDMDDLDMPDPVPGAVAICAQDCAGLEGEGWVDGDGAEVVWLSFPQVEAALYADILRGQARTAGRAVPRVWLAGPNGWQRVEDGQDLSHVVGATPFLNPSLFPNAPRPRDVPPPPKLLR